MNKRLIAALMFGLVALMTAVPQAGMADINELAKDWQVRSLKGITTVKYCVTYDPGNKLTKLVGVGLAGLPVPAKAVNINDASAKPLEASQARLKVFVDERAKGQSWVGLSVQQKSKLDRDPAITYDAETYKSGLLCSKGNVESAIKDLCAQFVRDFGGKAKKSK